MSVSGILGARSSPFVGPAGQSTAGPGGSPLFANLLQAATSKFNGIQAAASGAGNTVPNLAAKSATIPPKSVDLDQLRSDTDKLTSNFRTTLNRLLEEHGIDTSQAFSLQADPFGGIQVAGEHPQKDAIEQIFAEHFELKDAFNQLQQNYGTLREASQAAGPQLLPSALQVGYSASQFADNDPPAFSLVVRNGQASVAFV
jgi:hypothetical protein